MVHVLSSFSVDPNVWIDPTQTSANLKGVRNRTVLQHLSAQLLQHRYKQWIFHSLLLLIEQLAAPELLQHSAATGDPDAIASLLIRLLEQSFILERIGTLGTPLLKLAAELGYYLIDETAVRTPQRDELLRAVISAAPRLGSHESPGSFGPRSAPTRRIARIFHGKGMMSFLKQEDRMSTLVRAMDQNDRRGRVLAALFEPHCRGLPDRLPTSIWCSSRAF